MVLPSVHWVLCLSVVGQLVMLCIGMNLVSKSKGVGIRRAGSGGPSFTLDSLFFLSCRPKTFLVYIITAIDLSF